MNGTPTLAPDAAIALGIASAALPFAGTPAAASECWLRILRLHGEAGFALQAIGVGEDMLEAPRSDHRGQRDGDAEGDDALAHVTDGAARIADERGAEGIATTDLLLAVMEAYGADFDRALRAHGTDREELYERLGFGG